MSTRSAMVEFASMLCGWSSRRSNRILEALCPRVDVLLPEIVDLGVVTAVQWRPLGLILE